MSDVGGIVVEGVIVIGGVLQGGLFILRNKFDQSYLLFTFQDLPVI